MSILETSFALIQTIKKKGFGQPFAPFVGVNHHKQTIIFGVVFLYDAMIDSFVWLYETFCEAMSKKMTRTILTNQDKTMSAAIEKRH